MESRVPREEYVKLGPADRVRTWKWWFILLLVLGLLAAAWAVWQEFSVAPEPEDIGQSVGASVFTLAFLQAGSTSDPSEAQTKRRSDEELRPFIMVGILVLIAIITLVCLWVSLSSTNASAVSTASDLLKTCIGFFIGIATGYFG